LTAVRPYAMGRAPWTDRLTVQDCRIFLPVEAFNREGMFDYPPGVATTEVTWPNFLTCTPLARMFCRLRFREPHGLALAIPADDPETAALCDMQTIPLLTTRPYLGGQRFWFQCECGRRVGRLYLPGGQRVFRCRHCWNLTYQSAQEHDQRKYRMARNLAAIEAALHDARLGRQLLGSAALLLRFRWRRNASPPRRAGKLRHRISGTPLTSPPVSTVLHRN
jgi:hypothetical protein